MSDRIPWLDNLKALAIIFVVLGHTVGVPACLQQLIFSFHMPIFFFMAGMLATEAALARPFRVYLKEKVRKRLVPYAAFAALSLTLWFFLFRHFGTQAAKGIAPQKALTGIAYGLGINDWLIVNTPLWFFLCLFVTEVFFFFIIKLQPRFTAVLALVGLSLAGYLDTTVFNPPNGLRLPWNADIALTTVVFYGAGFLIKPFVLHGLAARITPAAGLCIAAAPYIGFSLLNTSVAVVAGTYGNYLYFYAAAFSGIVFWICVAMLLPPSRLLKKIGASTLVIFPMHLLVFPFLTGFFIYGLRLSPGFKEGSLFFSIVFTTASILILLPAADLINRRFPWMLGLKRDHRSAARSSAKEAL